MTRTKCCDFPKLFKNIQALRSEIMEGARYLLSEHESLNYISVLNLRAPSWPKHLSRIRTACPDHMEPSEILLECKHVRSEVLIRAVQRPTWIETSVHVLDTPVSVRFPVLCVVREFLNPSPAA